MIHCCSPRGNSIRKHKMSKRIAIGMLAKRWDSRTWNALRPEHKSILYWPQTLRSWTSEGTTPETVRADRSSTSDRSWPRWSRIRAWRWRTLSRACWRLWARPTVSRLPATIRCSSVLWPIWSDGGSAFRSTTTARTRTISAPSPLRHAIDKKPWRYVHSVALPLENYNRPDRNRNRYKTTPVP